MNLSPLNQQVIATVSRDEGVSRDQSSSQEMLDLTLAMLLLLRLLTAILHDLMLTLAYGCDTILIITHVGVKT